MRGDDIRRSFRLESAQRDLEDELRFHFESFVEDEMRAGRSRDEAEAEARRRFGDESAYRARLKRIDRGTAVRRRWSERLDGAATTVRHAWRGIGRTPGLALGIILAFALGIGANATVFGIVDRLLLSAPPHIEAPDGVKRLMVDRYVSFMNGRTASTTITWPDYEDLTALESFSAVAAYTRPIELTVGRGDDAERVAAASVTASFWEVLGVRPVLGRMFTAEEDGPGAAGTAVLDYGYWQRRYGGSASVLGETIDFGYGPYTVIGVTPRGFTGVSLSPAEVWLPFTPSTIDRMGEDYRASRGYYFFSAVGRLAPDVTEERAAAEATAAHRAGRASDIERDFYDPDVRIVPVSIVPGRAPKRTVESGAYVSNGARSLGTESDVALWLAGVSAVVLLIASVNVANLLLARALRQRREVGIRLALGVSQARLIGQTLAESMILALAGGVAAIVAARWGGDLLRGVLLPGISWEDSSAWGRTAVVALGLAVLAGLIAALAPAREAARGDVAATLRSSAAGITRSANRTRALLAVTQAALSVMLLIGAGLFLRSLNRISGQDLGFAARELTLIQPIYEAGEVPPAERNAFFEAGLSRLRSIAGAERVTYSRGIPMYTSYAYGLDIDGLDSIPDHPQGGPYVHMVGPDYLDAFGLDVVRGRGFAAGDVRGAAPVALVNEAFAQHMWPGQEALGKCLRIDQDDDEPPVPCTAVVGIVADARRNAVREEATPQYYIQLRQELIENATPEVFVVRTRPGTELPMQAVRRALLDIEPRLRWAEPTPFDELIDPQIRSWRLGATMFTAFGALALLVAAIGLYSVLGFDVAQRTREIGLRTALGADRRAILGMIVRRGVVLAVVGVGIGVVAALAVSPRMGELLYETSPWDPAVLGAAACALIAVAALASGIPAWRAARVDPNDALRAE
jgi:putative ABC transport system permease protein